MRRFDEADNMANEPAAYAMPANRARELLKSWRNGDHDSVVDTVNNIVDAPTRTLVAAYLTHYLTDDEAATFLRVLERPDP